MNDLASMSDADLIDMLAKLQVVKGSLQRQLEFIGPTNSDWYGRTKSALQRRAAEYLLVKAEIRKRTTARQASMPVVFMRIAKQRLDAETYQEILEEAKQEGMT